MTFRKYSKFTASSPVEGSELVLLLPPGGATSAGGVGDGPFKIGPRSDDGVPTSRDEDGVAEPLVAQYPTPGFRCFSRRAADD